MCVIWEENILGQGSSHNISVALLWLNTNCVINIVQNKTENYEEQFVFTNHKSIIALS